MKSAMRYAAISLCTAIVAGCAPVSQGQWNTEVTTMQGSPAWRRQAIIDCTATAEKKPESVRVSMSKVMNVAPDKTPRVFCERMIRAVANGRLTYAEATDIWAKRGDRSEYIEIIQGR